MKIRLTGAAALAVFAISAPLALAGTIGIDDGRPAEEVVTICHMTGSVTNPVVSITVSQNAEVGHLRHEGDKIGAGSTCVGLDLGPPLDLGPGDGESKGPGGGPSLDLAVVRGA